MEKTIRATKRRSVQETRIAGEVPGKRLTEPERTPRLGIAARKKPPQMPDEDNRNIKIDMATGMKHASFRPYGEALSKPIGRIGLLFMLACCSAWTGCRRPDRPSSVSERLQERKWIVQFPGPKDYSCEMRFTATERIVTLVYMGRHESRSDYRLFDEPACRFDPAETAGNENGRYIVTRTLVRGGADEPYREEFRTFAISELSDSLLILQDTKTHAATVFRGERTSSQKAATGPDTAANRRTR